MLQVFSVAFLSFIFRVAKSLVLVYCLLVYFGHVDGIEVSRDIIGPQLIGSYENIVLPKFQSPDPTSFPVCPDILEIGRVELLQTDAATLYILPHRFITLVTKGGGRISCEGTEINSPLSKESSTILRRNDQISPLDTNNSLINAFEIAKESYFLGLELGRRKCGLSQLQSDSSSMWVAPERQLSIQVPPSGFLVQFIPGFKYVIYFNALNPCILFGNASEQGIITAAPSPSSSTTSTITATPSESATSSVSSSFIPSQSQTPLPLPPINTGSLPQVSQVIPLQNDDPVCFPGSASVPIIESGKVVHVQMDELRIGMVVDMGKRHMNTCEVIGFTHRDANKWSWMVHLDTGNHTILKASRGHFIYAVQNGVEMVTRADSVRIGDLLIDADTNRYRQVLNVEYVWERGLYNAQTTCGDIVVNGIVATTYTAAVNSVETGHALMAPWRAASLIFRQVLCY